jgi:hypothetical protein
MSYRELQDVVGALREQRKQALTQLDAKIAEAMQAYADEVNASFGNDLAAIEAELQPIVAECDELDSAELAARESWGKLGFHHSQNLADPVCAATWAKLQDVQARATSARKQRQALQARKTDILSERNSLLMAVRRD